MIKSQFSCSGSNHKLDIMMRRQFLLVPHTLLHSSSEVCGVEFENRETNINYLIL